MAARDNKAEDFVPSDVSTQISTIFSNVAAQLPTLCLSDDGASDCEDESDVDSKDTVKTSHVSCRPRPTAEMASGDLLSPRPRQWEDSEGIIKNRLIREGCKDQESDELPAARENGTDAMQATPSMSAAVLPDVYMNQNATVPTHLSLGKLESVDFDTLLANLADNGSGRGSGSSFYMEESSGQRIIFERPQSSSLMDQLSQLSADQSKERWKSDHVVQQFHHPNHERDGLFRDSNRKEKEDDIGLWKEIVGKKETEAKVMSTVVLDLRPSQCKVGPVKESQMPEFLRDMLGSRLTLDNNSETSDSDSDNDDDPLSWHQYRQKFKSLNRKSAGKETGFMETNAKEHVPVVGAKRLLRCEPATEQNGHMETRTKENIVGTKRPVRQRPMFARQRKSEKKLETESKVKTGTTSETQSIPHEAECVLRETTAIEEHQKELLDSGVNSNENTVGSHEQKGSKRQKSQAEWEKKERQRRRRLELERRVEEKKPVTSVSDSHSSAVNSPLLYHMEASFDSPMSSLPTDCLHNHLALLSVQLCTSISISLPHSTSQTSCVHAAYHSLIVLVSWLLSLVHISEQPRDPMNGENNDRDDKEPFNVVGCQIVVYEDCPYLVTGITHRTEDVSSKQNDVFIKKVKSFLQRTNLSKIYNKLFPGHSSTACCFPNSDVDLFASDFTTSLSAFVSVTDDPIAVNKAFNSFSSFYSVTLDVGFECTNFALSSNPILSIVQTSVSTFHYALLHQPQQVATVLFRVFQSGLSLSGLRLVYETGNNEPRLVVVLRGNNAIMKWIEEIGPSDPVLARTTDPVSLRALFGGDTRSNTLISCVRNETTSHYEIVHYMGDRVSEDHVVTSFTHSMCKKGISKPFPDCLLISDVMLPKVICHTTSDVLLICSPLCPVTAMGDILQICSDRGFAVVGLKRQRLNKQMGKKLSFTDTNQLRVFTPMLSNSCHPPIPSLIINLVKENAATHVHSLIQHLLLCFPSDQRSLPYFHAVNPTESVLETGLAEFSSVPSHDSTVVLGVTTSYPTSLPQPLFITLSGHRAVALIGKLLCDLFIEAKYFQKTGNTSKNGSVFELVGIKLIPMLSSYLAKQITPFEIGSSQWQASVRSLCNKPTAFILVRSVNGITPATKVINNLSLTNNEVLLCTLRPEAVRLTSSVFKDSELSFDFSCHTLIEYLPDHLSSIKAGVATRIPGRSRRIGQRRTNDQYATSVQESVLNSLIMAPVDIPTVAVLKPHVMQKHLAAILDCLTNKAGFSVVGMDMRRLTVVEAKTLIRDENINEMSLEDLDGHIKSFTSGPSLVLCLMAVNGVKQLLDLLGLQDPKQAKELDPCSLRAIYGVDEQHNGIYASTSYKNAVEDIKLLFPHGLCCSLSPFLHDEGIHCPAIGMDVMDNKNNEHSQNVGNDDNTKEHNGANASTSEGNMSVDLSPTRDNLGDQGQQPASHIVSPPRSLKQTTCIVFPSCLVTETRHDKVSKLIYVDVIRGLITKCGFCPTAMKMVWFNAEEARCLNLIMECSNQTDRFTAGPCVAIALERDNAIVCFDVLADSCLAIKPIYSKYRNEMAISQSSRQAAAMLQFLFSVVYGGLTQEVYLQ